MVQNKNNMVKALTNAVKIFINTAADCGLPKSVKNLPKSIKNGAPGGCPTSSLYDMVINSPQSQKLAVGSMVIKYTANAMAKVIHPTIIFSFL